MTTARKMPGMNWLIRRWEQNPLFANPVTVGKKMGEGSIENRNGILRGFYPKKTDWALTTQMETDRTTKLINSMPLKI
jgi:IS30 family transposase